VVLWNLTKKKQQVKYLCKKGKVKNATTQKIKTRTLPIPIVSADAVVGGAGMPDSTTGVDSVRTTRGKTHGSKKECYSRRHGKGGKIIQQENKNTHQKVFHEAKQFRHQHQLQ
jgi:hypothetical protein